MLAYAPLAALPVVYLYLGSVNGSWLAPLDFSFGLPLTVASFGAVLFANIKSFAYSRGIITEQLIVCLMADLIWIILFFVQTFIRRVYRADTTTRAQWIWLVGWSNVLGLAIYFLLKQMLYTVGL